MERVGGSPPLSGAAPPPVFVVTLLDTRNAIWTMKFSCDRKYLATGGEDGVVNIWKVRKVTKEEWNENMDARIFEDQPVRSYSGHTVSIGAVYHDVVAYCGFCMVQERIPPLRLSRL